MLITGFWFQVWSSPSLALNDGHTRQHITLHIANGLLLIVTPATVCSALAVINSTTPIITQQFAFAVTPTINDEEQIEWDRATNKFLILITLEFINVHRASEWRYSNLARWRL